MESFKCLICGMNVNPNSMSINKSSFLPEKVSGGPYCPFCGVEGVYLQNGGEVYIHMDETLDQQTLDILDKAMKLEVFNGEFYSRACELASDDAFKKMFKDLSSIEMMHARIHMKMGGFSSLPDLITPTYYEKLSSDELLISEANSREKHAVAFYEKSMDSICSERVKEVFRALSTVEKEHIELTKK